jgi:hypothetical protein
MFDLRSGAMTELFVLVGFAVLDYGRRRVFLAGVMLAGLFPCFLGESRFVFFTFLDPGRPAVYVDFAWVEPNAIALLFDSGR